MFAVNNGIRFILNIYVHPLRDASRLRLKEREISHLLEVSNEHTQYHQKADRKAAAQHDAQIALTRYRGHWLLKFTKVVKLCTVPSAIAVVPTWSDP